MDMHAAMNAMQNPQATMMQYAIQGMIAQHPDMWQQAQQMFAGKNKKQQIAALRNLYKQKGLDLDAMTKQWGITL